MSRQALLIGAVLVLVSCGTDDRAAVDSVASTSVAPTTSAPTSSTASVTTSKPIDTTSLPAMSLHPDAVPTLSLRVDTDRTVEVVANEVCDANSNCRATSEPAPQFETGAFVSNLVLHVTDADATLEVIEPDWLVALPRRDGTWVIENPGVMEPQMISIVSHAASGAVVTYSFRMSRLLPSSDEPFLLPESPGRTLMSVDEAAWPDDLPATFIGYRLSTGDLVSVDRASRAQTVLTKIEPPGSDPESCPDSCGVYHVAPSPDGKLVYFGGPGPAVGQVFVLPADRSGSGTSEPILGGNSPSVSFDGLVATSAFGVMVFDPTDLAQPVYAFGESSGAFGTSTGSFSLDGQRLFVLVNRFDEADVVSVDFRSADPILTPVIDVSDLGWQQVAQRADGMLVMVRSWAGEPRPLTIDVIDPLAGTIVDSIELDASVDGASRWVDLDATGRYLLFTAGDGTLRWTDFHVMGSFGDGWGDAGW